jgi:hypothetical protein
LAISDIQSASSNGFFGFVAICGVVGTGPFAWFSFVSSWDGSWVTLSLYETDSRHGARRWCAVSDEKYSVKSKIMKTSKFKSILLLTLMVATGAKAQTIDNEKPTINFVHGIWADGSCWTNQIAALQAKGYHVVSVQNP